MEKRSYRQLSLEEREYISGSWAEGQGVREIAAVLERDPSTVSREVRRNGTQVAQGYAPVSAHIQAMQRATRRGQRGKLSGAWLWREVLKGLRRRWSPEQIAGDLKTRYPKQSERQVSHESIYAGMYLLPRGALRSELLSYLRQARKERRPRARGTDRRGQIPNMVSISERAASVETRRVAGHWEGDLIKGAGNRSAVATLVERHSRYLVVVRVEDSSALSVCRGLARHFRRLPAALRRTLTYDRGREMACHEDLTQKTRVKIYFADPHSPWQRGTNENTNGLLRQYLPKGEDLSGYTQTELTRIARELNSRPRKIHGWATPAEIYNRAASVALQS